MRIVFLGSPEPVLPILKTLLDDGPGHGHELVGVVSQPARPTGRSGREADPPVAAWAKEHKIMTMQPTKASDAGFQSALSALQPDIMITAAYGQILNDAFLRIPKRGTINIHPSLLPAWRGAIPVQAALLHDDKETGVSILFTVKQLDAGNLILQDISPIHPEETADVLLNRLFLRGAGLLFEALEKLNDPAFEGTPQGESGLSHCKKISKDDGSIDWNKPTRVLFSQFRAYHPWPGSFSFLEDKRIAILGMRIPAADQTQAARMLAPGVALLNKSAMAIEVVTGDGSLLVTRLQLAGGKPLDAMSFWNGLKQREGLKFGLPAI